MAEGPFLSFPKISCIGLDLRSRSVHNGLRLLIHNIRFCRTRGEDTGGQCMKCPNCGAPISGKSVPIAAPVCPLRRRPAAESDRQPSRTAGTVPRFRPDIGSNGMLMDGTEMGQSPCACSDLISRFAPTNSRRFLLRRTAHRAGGRFVCPSACSRERKEARAVTRNGTLRERVTDNTKGKLKTIPGESDPFPR